MNIDKIRIPTNFDPFRVIYGTRGVAKYIEKVAESEKATFSHKMVTDYVKDGGMRQACKPGRGSRPGEWSEWSVLIDLLKIVEAENKTQGLMHSRACRWSRREVVKIIKESDPWFNFNPSPWTRTAPVSFSEIWKDLRVWEKMAPEEQNIYDIGFGCIEYEHDPTEAEIEAAASREFNWKWDSEQQTLIKNYM